MTKDAEYGAYLTRSGLKNTKHRTAILDILEQAISHLQRSRFLLN